jgi:hypothetical protein
VSGREAPFHSAIREHLKGQTQALEDLAIEMLARGLSVRDIEDAFKDERPVAAVTNRGVRIGGAALGGLPGLRRA